MKKTVFLQTHKSRRFINEEDKGNFGPAMGSTFFVPSEDIAFLIEAAGFRGFYKTWYEHLLEGVTELFPKLPKVSFSPSGALMEHFLEAMILTLQEQYHLPRPTGIAFTGEKVGFGWTCNLNEDEVKILQGRIPITFDVAEPVAKKAAAA